MSSINLARSDMEPTDEQLQVLASLAAVDVKARAAKARSALLQAVELEIERAVALDKNMASLVHPRMAAG